MTDTILPEVQKDYSLKPYNTLGIAATASHFITVRSAGELKKVLLDPDYRDVPKFILGGGSNVLFAGDVEGLVVHIAIGGIEIRRENKEHVWIEAGAGVNWHSLVLHCVEMGWGGIENLSLIPGTVGAAPIQNIGAYGAELEEVFELLEAIRITTGETRTFSREECRFEYRDSIFKNELKGEFVITRVVLRLSKHPVLNTSYGALRSRLEEKGIRHPTIRNVSDAVVEIRNSKLPDPAEIGNAGSFFKNPEIDKGVYTDLKREYPGMPGYPLNDGRVKVPAGWLIEKTGWKGKVVGNTGTYRQQALVIVNHGGATGDEILGLARDIKASVADIFGIELVPEVNIIG